MQEMAMSIKWIEAVWAMLEGKNQIKTKRCCE